MLRLARAGEAQRAQRPDRARHRGVLQPPRRRACKAVVLDAEGDALLRRAGPVRADRARRVRGPRALPDVAPGVRADGARADAGRRGAQGRGDRRRAGAGVGDAPAGGRAERVLRAAGGAARAVRRRRRLGAGAAADRRAPDGRHDAHRPRASTPRRGRRSGCRTTWSARARGSPQALELAHEDRGELAGHELRRAAGAAADRRGQPRRGLPAWSR